MNEEDARTMENQRAKGREFQEYAGQVEAKIAEEASSAPARWWLLTDGSGTSSPDDTLVPGSSAWVVYDAVNNTYHVGVIGFTSSSVDRAEMQAALGGFEFIQDQENVKLVPGTNQTLQRVVWIGDRESMLRAAMWKYDKSGTLYRRQTNKHLWAQYEWFERRFHIFPIRRNRNTVAAQKLCDCLCGQLRVKIKEWFLGEITQETIINHLKPKT